MAEPDDDLDDDLDDDIAALDDYDAMNAFWDAITRDVAEMRAVIRRYARVFGLDGQPGALLEPDATTPRANDAPESDTHVLVILCIDSDSITAATMIPRRLIDDRLAWALSTIDGRTFAGAADLSRDQWDAAVLVMSALALEMRDATDLARWAHDEGSTITTDEITRYWNAWSGYDVRTWNDLARPCAAVYSLRRAM